MMVRVALWERCTAEGGPSFPRRIALPVCPSKTGAWGRGRANHKKDGTSDATTHWNSSETAKNTTQTLLINLRSQAQAFFLY